MGTLAVGSVEAKNESAVFTFDSGYSDGSGATALETNDVSRWSNFTIGSTAGAFDVQVSLDGTNWLAVQSLNDLGSTSTAGGVVVIVAAAARCYGFSGVFKKIRVRQSGGSALTGLTMMAN